MSHEHDNDHSHAVSRAAPELDLTIADRELSPLERSRREFLRHTGLLAAGLGLANAGILASAGRVFADDDDAAPGGLVWLAGDHHIHTQYSSDARYRVADQVAHAARYGLHWMVITDHGRVAHEKVSIDRTLNDVMAARATFPGMLVYQGLEWNIPGAEHGTVFIAPGPNESAVLHQFEKNFDGVVLDQLGVLRGPTRNEARHEAKAIEAIRWLDQQITSGRTPAGLFLANHPARRGLDSPHEFRGWNDASPRVAVGMEGAPGHQAAGIARSEMGPQVARGYYDFAPGPDSFAGYPLESYRTFGGFDWITARLGGLWDALLSEGRRFWITANSDAHAVYKDSVVRGGNPPGTSADDDDPASRYYGDYGPPSDTGVSQAGNGDFWPGYYSRTWVGATEATYEAVMAGIAAGRMWVTHGDLVSGLDVRVTADDSQATLGGTVLAERGDSVTVSIGITLPRTPNVSGQIPRLRRVDLIAGPITGPSADRDAFTAPGTAVVASWEIDADRSVARLKYTFRNVRQSFYLRLRGTDGNFSAPNSIEPRLDPVPIDPWSDLWFYANPIFVNVAPET